MTEPPARPTIVTILAIIFIVGGIVLLMMSGLGAIVSLVEMSTDDPTLKDEPWIYPGMAFMTRYGWLLQVPFVALEGLMVVAGVRLLALRRWAWKTLRIVIVIYLLVNSAQSAWFFWAMSSAKPNPGFENPDGFPVEAMKWAIVGGTVVWLVISSAIALILYGLLGHPTVRRTIRDAEVAGDPDIPDVSGTG